MVHAFRELSGLRPLSRAVKVDGRSGMRELVPDIFDGAKFVPDRLRDEFQGKRHINLC
jgi:hypothetical protein